MAGLLIKELIIRGDLERCLVIAPGNLVEQWQDELKDKRAKFCRLDILERRTCVRISTAPGLPPCHRRRRSKPDGRN
jgi:hypothetical protein